MSELHCEIDKTYGGAESLEVRAEVALPLAVQLVRPMSEACVWLFSASISSPEQEVETAKIWDLC